MLKSIMILAFLHVIITNLFLQKTEHYPFSICDIVHLQEKKIIHKISINKLLKILKIFFINVTDLIRNAQVNIKMCLIY